MFEHALIWTAAFLVFMPLKNVGLCMSYTDPPIEYTGGQLQRVEGNIPTEGDNDWSVFTPY